MAMTAMERGAPKGLSLDTQWEDSVVNKASVIRPMENGALRGEDTMTNDSELLSTAALAAELEAIVDQLDSDLLNLRPIGQATAARIHALTRQAERLFGAFA